MQQFTPEVVARILQQYSEANTAKIFEGNTQKPFEMQSITLALDTARDAALPFKIGFPFRSVFVVTATDSNVSVNFRPNTEASFQSSVPLYIKDSYSLDQPCASAFLDWSAQAGKSITLVFFLSSEFRSGSQISVNSGGITLSEGSAFTNTRVNLTAATAGAVVASSSTRKVAAIQNNTGADVWFGTSAVSNTGANLGYKLGAGGTFYWRNSAALYGYSVAGGTGDTGLLVMEET